MTKSKINPKSQIQIYNTLSRKKEELTEKRIGLYVCGPTVYDEPHIGHARSAYIFDVIVKYLKYRGKIVTFVRNVTDIDDKIIEKAKSSIVHPSASLGTGGPQSTDLKNATREIAKRYLDAYHEDMDLLGMAKPDREPKATDVIPDMINFIKVLIKKGYAYVVSGDIYFDVRKFSGYGRLSGQRLDAMEEGARVAIDKNKKDPLDFALWKAAKEDEPFWESPWGNGRPGWHIECSVMSTKYLKNNFLIHGGGLDLVFPHHENEIAQTECAGKKSAKYWIHNGLLTINSQKMSKSLGNFISIKNFKAKHKDMDLVKMLFLSSHYRHPVDYTEEKIEEMRRAKERIVIFFDKLEKTEDRRPKAKGRRPKAEGLENKFIAAMDDDFNTPLALAAIFELVALGNICLEEGDLKSAKKVREIIEKLCGILGLHFKEPKIKLDHQIKEFIDQRNAARENRDFKKADEIRTALLEQGIILEDTKEGTAWRKKG